MVSPDSWIPQRLPRCGKRIGRVSVNRLLNRMHQNRAQTFGNLYGV